MIAMIPGEALVQWTNARLEGLDKIAPEMLSWFATLALHSSLLLVGALAAERFVSKARNREVLWRSAILLPFATATLAAWTSIGSMTWLVTRSREALVGELPLMPLEPGHFAPLLDADTTLQSPTLRTGILLACFLVTAIGLYRFALQRVRLTFWLMPRKRVVDSKDDERGLVARIADLARSLGMSRQPRVSVHKDLTTPIAFGIFRPEVCVPTRPLEELGERELDAALAHEVAHLACRDPLAFLLQNALVKLFWWQPLFRLACRRLEELAEFRCDALAADQTDKKAVASCLVELASWVHGKTAIAAALPSMAGRSSSLRRRVERVLDVDEPARFQSFGSLLLPACLLIGSATSLAMPKIRLASPEPDLASEVGLGGGGIMLSTESKMLFAALVQLDAEYASLAADFADLQKDLLSNAVAESTLNSLQAIGRLLNKFDARRIDLRSRILDSLAREARRLGSVSALDDVTNTPDAAPTDSEDK